MAAVKGGLEASIDAPRTAGIAAALTDAAKSALLMLGLGVPILLLRTEQDFSNRLVLQPRFGLLAYALIFGWASGLMRHLGSRGRTILAALLLAGFLLVRFALLKSERFGALDLSLTMPFASAVAVTFAGMAIASVLYLLAAAIPEAAANAAPARTVAMSSGASQIASLAGLAFLLIYPFLALALTGRAGSIKWIDNFGIQIMIYIMLGWGLNIVIGLAGLLDLGYVAFYAVGAYSYALLVQYFGMGFWICLPIAGILAAFWGVLLGFPVLRLRGDYLAIVTLAFGEIIRLILVNWVDFTQGYAGISGIPRPTFFGLPFNASDEGFAATLGIEFTPLHRTIFLFYTILALALVTNWVTIRLRRLPVGRAWEALREDEIACRSLGINTTNTKLTAFAIGAGFGGLAGCFFAARQGFISPESFTFNESAVIIAIVVLGGMGSQLGVAIAAVAMIGGTEILRELEWLKQVFGSDFDPTQYRMLIFGLAMVVLMIWKPRGLIATREPSIVLRERKAISGALVKEGHG